MVNTRDNDQNPDDQIPSEGKTPKKRSRLFGRRAAADAAAAAPQTAAAEPVAPDAPAAEVAPEAVAAQPRTRAPRTAPAKTAAPAQSAAPAKSAAPAQNAAPAKKVAPAKKAADHVAASEASTGDDALASDKAENGDRAAQQPVRRGQAGKTQTAKTQAGKTEPQASKAEITAQQLAPEPDSASQPVRRASTAVLFQAPDLPPLPPRSTGRGLDSGELPDDDEDEPGPVRRRSRRRPGEDARPGDEAPGTVVRVRQPRPEPVLSNEPTRVKGSTRLEAKKQRRRDGRDAGRRRPVVTESEFLARRESVDRVMVVRSKFDRIQIAVLEDGVLVEHYVAKAQDASLIGNVYLGRVQNVLPSMEAAFVDIGRGRNAVLYSGEVDWEAAAAESGETRNQARRIELALKPGDRVLVQVTKDPVGHKGARLTSQVSLPGRYLVYVPNGSMSGISRKLPDTERARLKKILKEVLPENVGVIVRTAAEGATDEQLALDVNRLTSQWAQISRQVESAQAPASLHSEPDLLIKIVRDVFNEDFQKLVIEGEDARQTIESYLRSVAPDLVDRLESYQGTVDSFDEYRVSEQIEKALDRKVWLPSGGSLVIDRTEAMTVIDVNTGKFVGSGGNLEETVTKNNIEAAEEIVRQLRLRDIGGIIVVDFIDMVLESNRDLVLRRLVECLSRDRTKHQVAEVTSLGLVQMTRKKLGLGLLETFSEPCEHCAGRGIIVHHDPVTKHRQQTQTAQPAGDGGGRRGRNRNGGGAQASASVKNGVGSAGTHAITEDVRNALARVAASTVNHGADTAPPAAAHEGAAGGAAGQAEQKPTQDAVQEPTAVPPVGPSVVLQQPLVHDQAPAHDPVGIEETVAILDIPVQKAPRQPRKVSMQDAEQILGSVLEALPEPKQPGQGRSRASRRVSSPIITTEAAPPGE